MRRSLSGHSLKRINATDYSASDLNQVAKQDDGSNVRSNIPGKIPIEGEF